ncbi:MAG: acyl-CoA thioesterase [Vicinamibacterales bacterium]
MSTPLITHRLTVRFRDCDAFGHVNNAVYFTYLEEARAALWRAMNLTGFDERGAENTALEMHGVSAILARAECDFRAPARFGDVLDVRLSLAAIGRTSFTYEYEIVGVPDGQSIAAGRTVQVLFDYTARRPVEIPESLRRTLSVMPNA